MHGKFFLILCLWNGFTKISTFSQKFPRDFIFGASTSSYQIEGAWNVDEKGKSIWDQLTHVHPNITNEQNGDEAAKSYYFYKEDSNFLKKIGFQLYRFSISWTRILPNGDLSKISEAGLKHYDDVINDLIEKGIKPMVTIYHWDLPQKLQETGGWLNSTTVDHITQYADLLFSRYGDRVKLWITINEPYFITQGYFNFNTFAPALGLGTPFDYLVAYHLLQAHMRISSLYRKKYKTRQNGKISIAMNYDPCYPKTQSKKDRDAANRSNEFTLGLMAHPIYSAEGNYPKLVRYIVGYNSWKERQSKSRLVALTKEEISALRGSCDFFSLNYYTSYVCSAPPRSASQSAQRPRPFYEDINVQLELNSSLPVLHPSNLPINPSGLRVALNQISHQYNYPEIFITENGLGDMGERNDTIRVNYIADHLRELLKAYHEDKCKIIGYSVWSLLDNFQWIGGYETKYGLIEVDFNSVVRKRTPRESFYFMQSVIEQRRVPNWQK